MIRIGVPRSVLCATMSIVLVILFGTVYCDVEADKAQFKPNIAERFPVVNDPNLKVERVFDGLDFPTSMGFLGPDDILVAEKNKGTIQRIIDGKMNEDPLLDVNVASRAERGLLGISILKGNEIPNGSGNMSTYVFVYFTKSTEGKDSSGERGEESGGNSLFSYELINSKLSNPVLLLQLSPKKGPAHNGGAMVIGSDMNIYLPIGDGDGDTTQAQNMINGSSPEGTGGIIKINPNGSSIKNITGNITDAVKYYSYGLRNSFGIDFDPVSGKLWDTENGLDSNDEINLVEPGFNSGWMKVQGKAPHDFDYSQLVNFNGSIVNGSGKYSDPEFSWYQTIGPTKIKFLDSDKLGKEYENDIFVSDIVNGRIYHFNLNEDRDELVLQGNLVDKVADSDEEIRELIFGSDFGGITDMDVGPDGYLYVLSFGEGAIYKISPK